MLKKSTADAFLISTRPRRISSDHEVIEADRIAIVEKPLCSKPEQMDALMTAARTRKLLLYTAFSPLLRARGGLVARADG